MSGFDKVEATLMKNTEFAAIYNFVKLVLELRRRRG